MNGRRILVALVAVALAPLSVQADELSDRFTGGDANRLIAGTRSDGSRVIQAAPLVGSGRVVRAVPMAQGSGPVATYNAALHRAGTTQVVTGHSTAARVVTNSGAGLGRPAVYTTDQAVVGPTIDQNMTPIGALPSPAIGDFRDQANLAPDFERSADIHPDVARTLRELPQPAEYRSSDRNVVLHSEYNHSQLVSQRSYTRYGHGSHGGTFFHGRTYYRPPIYSYPSTPRQHFYYNPPRGHHYAVPYSCPPSYYRPSYYRPSYYRPGYNHCRPVYPRCYSSGVSIGLYFRF